MPRPEYKKRLSDDEVLELVRSGRYRVDLRRGRVFSELTGKRLHETRGGRCKRYRYVRLFDSNERTRMIPVAHMVWIVGNERPLPEGFEVHHWDRNPAHNWWTNVYALSLADHRKIKRRQEAEAEEVPF